MATHSSTTTSSTATSPSDATATNQNWEAFQRKGSFTIPLDSLGTKEAGCSRRWSVPHRESIRTLDDIERALHGYPRLATFMAHEPGAAIARRFGSVNLRILLYKQAEIVCLEHDLDELEQSYSTHRHIHYSVREFIHAKPGSVAGQIWDKIQKLEHAIEQYNRLLLQQKALYELPEADDRDINDLNNFIANEEMGGAWLEHPEDTIWSVVYEKGKYKAEQKDLVRLSGSAHYIDPFTRWLWGPCLSVFHKIYQRLFRPDKGDGSYTYNETTINLIGRTTSLAMATLLPTASIIALYYIDNNLWRLIFILLFSTVFTVCLSIFTAATRIEIFLASLGLASVQAVFVGNLIGGSPYAVSGSAPPHG